DTPVNVFLQTAATSDGANGTLTRSYTNDAFGNPAGQTIAGSSGLSGSFLNTRTFLPGSGLLLADQRTNIGWKSFNVDREANEGKIVTSYEPRTGQTPVLSTSNTYRALGPLRKIT